MGYCNFCQVTHSGSCCHPGQTELQRLRTENEVLRKQLRDHLESEAAETMRADRLRAEKKALIEDRDHWRNANRETLSAGDILKAENSALRNAVKITIPTDTMEQEFQAHYRRGYAAGQKMLRETMVAAMRRETREALNSFLSGDGEGVWCESELRADVAALHAENKALRTSDPARGYALLGTGQYAINHSAAGEFPEIVITLATDAEKSNREISEERDNPPGSEIRAEDMLIRIGFTSESALYALESQLAWIRKVHFKDAVIDATMKEL